MTGDHKVRFDADGGYNTLVTQTVRGGNRAVEPKDPKRDGYVFLGWYYTDENGKEVKWDFTDPVNQNMTLKAKWKKEQGQEEDKENTAAKNKKDGSSKDNTKWNYKEIHDNSESTKAAKTGEKSKFGWGFISLLTASGIVYCIRKKKRNL